MAGPRFPIRKSQEEIQFYQKYGPVFGEVLQKLKAKVEEGKQNIEDLFVQECHKTFLKWEESIYIPQFPFIEECNYLDEKFGHAVCVSPNSSVAHGRPCKLNTGDIV
ncbi:MAG: hypothetical protein ACXABY_29700, partial [Candidatus Thorarchaeota archaeon]